MMMTVTDADDDKARRFFEKGVALSQRVGQHFISIFSLRFFGFVEGDDIGVIGWDGLRDTSCIRSADTK